MTSPPDPLLADHFDKRFKPLPYHVIARRLSRIKRYIFREKIAYWIGDLAEIVEDVFDWLSERLNSFRLLPAFLAVWLAPRHFFRRLPLSRRARHSLYVKPGFFLTHLAVLTIAIVFWAYPHFPAAPRVGALFNHYAPPWLMHAVTGKEKLFAEFFLLIFCFATPLWIVPLSVVMFLVHEVFIAPTWTMVSPYESLASARYKRSKPVRHHFVFLVPLSRQAYDHLLDRKQYIWAVCYFGLFGFLMLHLIGLGTFASYSAAKHLLGWGALIPFAPVFTLLLFVPVIFSEILIVRPNVEILRAARKPAIKQMCLVDCEDVRFAVSMLIAELTDLVRLNADLAYSPRVEDSVERDRRLFEISQTARELLIAWSDLNNLWKMQEFDLNLWEMQEDPHLREARLALKRDFSQERSKIFLQTVKLDKLQRLLPKAKMNPSDALCITRVVDEVRKRLA